MTTIPQFFLCFFNNLVFFAKYLLILPLFQKHFLTIRSFRRCQRSWILRKNGRKCARFCVFCAKKYPICNIIAPLFFRLISQLFFCHESGISRKTGTGKTQNVTLALFAASVWIDCRKVTRSPLSKNRSHLQSSAISAPVLCLS